MSNKRILVVDDDPDLLFLVAHGVKSLAPEYLVTTAANGTAALEKVQNEKFDLLVSDFMMPEMTGLELIRQAKQISPETKFILMTAHHDTNRIRNKVDDVELSGFVGKPFAMPNLLDVVQRVMAGGSSDPGKAAEIETPTRTIREALGTLRRQTGAHSVVLVSSDGAPVYAAGEVDRAKVSRLAAFVSANFLAIAELAHLFGDNDSVFNSSYYEGNKYNIYACNVNDNCFLAVVVGVGSKPGTVWFYTKQAAAAVATQLPAPEPKNTHDNEQTMAQDFENLLGNETELDD